MVLPGTRPSASAAPQAWPACRPAKTSSCSCPPSPGMSSSDPADTVMQLYTTEHRVDVPGLAVLASWVTQSPTGQRYLLRGHEEMDPVVCSD